MRIDSHQHFWRYSAAEYPWIGAGMERLARDWHPDDLAAVAAAEGIGGTVAVQARQSVEESRWLLTLADAHPLVDGVVGWVDLQSEAVAETLAGLSSHPKFVGVRHVVQDEPDDRFLLGAAFVRGLAQLRRFGLVYDLLLYPRQLPAAVELVARLPDQPFVLDHLAKPGIKAGAMQPWRADIERLAKHPHVACKISGLVTEAAWRGWKRSDFTPYLEIALDAFGPKRLLFGSDWPVCLVAADYADVAGIADDFLARLSGPEQDAVWGGNATDIYGLTSRNTP
ncbi:MAG: amidohydrolase family protein [Planctomycetia bacterium]